MKDFPFSEEEWSVVSSATSAVMNATLANDSVLCASTFAELQAVLTDLRKRYGDHPVLLETEADFAPNTVQQRNLYRQAIQLATQLRLRTYTIRISLAQLLLDEFDDAAQALKELVSCEGEIQSFADDSEKRDWSELVTNCKRRTSQSDELRSG